MNIDLAISEFKFEDFPEKNKKSPLLQNSDQKSPEKPGKLANIELFKDINGKFLKIRNESLCEILELEEFNIEDKLFLNKIAFLGFRKFGQQYKFKDFHKYCRKLQVIFINFENSQFFAIKIGWKLLSKNAAFYRIIGIC